MQQRSEWIYSRVTSNLLQLQYLYLYSNGLSGSIPESLGSLSQLREFRASNNDLIGSIPESLGNLLQLQFFFDNNCLNGSIPESLGTCHSCIDFICTTMV